MTVAAMSYVEQAEFREHKEEFRILIGENTKSHDALAGKFASFVKESQDFMEAEIKKVTTELREQIADTMRDAGAETATHKAEIDDKVNKQEDGIKDKVKKQDEENERRKAALNVLEAELK